jgi:HrpA-like RNA helicase
MIFCHGVSEINELTQHYQGYLNSNRFEVYPLHGKITPEEQRKAFMHTTKHKLIFASRIAETAITIDDVRVVVDPGEDYELVYNQKHKFSSMKLRFISQSSAKQRAGRAGRTSPGFCFRLYS